MYPIGTKCRVTWAPHNLKYIGEIVVIPSLRTKPYGEVQNEGKKRYNLICQEIEYPEGGRFRHGFYPIEWMTPIDPDLLEIKHERTEQIA